MNKADQAYDAVEAMITFRDLAPGSLISESLLMDRTGLGRTPVREALQRLARERMVEIHPSRGVFVASLSVEEQLKLLELRRAVEELAVRLAAVRGEPQQRDRMRLVAQDMRRHHKTDVRAFGALLKAAHEVIVRAAHNDYIEVAMAPLQGLSRRYWFSQLQDTAADLKTAAQFHRAILIATSEGDEDRAADASKALNTYLTEFAIASVRRLGSHSQAVHQAPA